MGKLLFYLRKTLLIGLFLFFQTAFLMAVVTKTVGASGADFTTIQGAYNSITTVTEPIEIVLQADYNSSGETYPITLGAKTGASAVNTITIKPGSGVSKTIAAPTPVSTTTTAASTATTSFTGTLNGLAAGEVIGGMGLYSFTGNLTSSTGVTVSSVTNGIVTLTGPGANAPIPLTSVNMYNASWLATSSSGTICKVSNAKTTSASKNVTLGAAPSGFTLAVGMLVGGNGIPVGTTIETLTSQTAFTISNNATNTVAGQNGSLFFTSATGGKSVAPSAFQIPLTSTAGLAVGNTVSGSVPAGSTISAVNGNNIYVSASSITNANFNYANGATLSFASNATIYFNGAQYVIIDGGSKANLSIENPNTSSNTIILQNGASNNKILNCTIKGVSLTNAYATILIGSASQTLANNNNLIDNCDIRDGATKPQTAIAFWGASGIVNTGNTISNSNLFNIGTTAAGNAFFFYFTGNSSASTTIDGNRMYWTSDLNDGAVANTYYGILARGEGNIIKNNVIGYKANDGTGIFKLTSTTNSRFIGIKSECGTSYANRTLIDNNTISNVTLEVASSGTAYNYEAVVSGIIGNANGAFTGTYGDFTNNKVQNLKLYNSVAPNQSTYALFAMNIFTANTLVTGNIIDNIIARGGTEATAANYVTTVRGIQIYQNVGSSSTVSGNKVSNIVSGDATIAAVSSAHGIFCGAETVSTIEKNSVYNVSAINNAGTATTFGLVVFNSSTSTTPTYVKNNIVRLGTDNTVGNIIHAIYQQESSTGNGYKVYFYNNSAYVGGTIASGITGNSYAFNRAITAGTKLAELKNNILVNVRTGGTTGKHFAINLNNATDYSSSYLASNYNIFQIGASNNAFGLVVAAEIADFTTWKSTCTGFDANSYNSDPQFNGATALTPDLTINPNLVSDADAKGADLSANVTHDFAGTLRSSKTPYDIGAYGYISNQISSEINVNDLTLTPSSDIQVKAGAHLIINQSTSVGTITVAPGAKVTVSGANTLSASSGITLQSSPSATATLVDNYDNPTITATVEQYLPQGRNWYMASPIETNIATAANLTSAGATSVSYYSEQNGWQNSYSGTLSEGVGYVAVSASGSNTNKISFNGKLNSGDVPVTLTRKSTGSFAGYNLIANPYPSYINVMPAINANNNLETTIWYRTRKTVAPYEYKFETVNTTSGVGTNAAGTGMVTGYIPPMQAFWVKTNADMQSFTFTNSMRDHARNVTVGSETIPTTPLKAKKQETQRIARILVAGNSGSDEAVLYFNENASNSFDRYDSRKMFEGATATTPEIYSTVGNEKLVINGLNAFNNETEIQLGFIAKQAGDYSITGSGLINFESGTSLILKDKQNPTAETELSEGTVYNFSSQVTSGTDRFSLLFRAPGVTTGVNSTEKLNAQVFVNAANHITIIAPEKSNYAIYNALGQLSAEGTINHSPFTINHSKGVYVVKVNNQSTRVIIK